MYHNFEGQRYRVYGAIQVFYNKMLLRIFIGQKGGKDKHAIKIKFSDYQNKNPRTSSKIFYNAKTKYYDIILSKYMNSLFYY